MHEWNFRKEGTNHPSFYDAVFDPSSLKKLVSIVAKDLTKLRKTVPFDAIAGSGNSGLPLMGALSLKMGVPMIAVRKPGDKDNRTERWAGGFVGCDRYIIIDDLVDS